uniref:Vesicle-associated membrane protein 3 n=1 Tax=Schistocephalus solidus TaxID=70667 RepID=A0A0X3NWD6_SCHSO
MQSQSQVERVKAQKGQSPERARGKTEAPGLCLLGGTSGGCDYYDNDDDDHNEGEDGPHLHVAPEVLALNATGNGLELAGMNLQLVSPTIQIRQFLISFQDTRNVRLHDVNDLIDLRLLGLNSVLARVRISGEVIISRGRVISHNFGGPSAGTKNSAPAHSH